MSDDPQVQWLWAALILGSMLALIGLIVGFVLGVLA